MIAIVDIETSRIPESGLISDIEQIFCIGIKIDDNPTLCFTSNSITGSAGTLQQGINLINKCSTMVFHNGIKFDIPVLTKYFSLTPAVVDTLLDTKIMYSKDYLTSIDYTISTLPKDLIASHSLKAFGYRLGLDKLDSPDFTELTEEMLTYCIRDVDITYKLYHFINSQDTYPLDSVRELEYTIAYLMYIQQESGFYFDIAKAKKLELDYKFEKLSIEHSLLRTFHPKYLPDGDVKTPTKVRITKQWIISPNWQRKDRSPLRKLKIFERYKNGKYKKKHILSWDTIPHRLLYTTYCGSYQPIKLVKFNPGSRQHIQRWLKDLYNWSPDVYTPTGNPKVDYDTLEALPYENTNDLKDYLRLVKFLGILSEGGNSLCNLYNSTTHRLHGRVDSLGANTGRMTHSLPNITQVPKEQSFRELLCVPPNRILIDVDADALELVMLGHYLGPYDNYAYAKIVDSGKKEDKTDVHSVNQRATGLPTRDAAKTFIYGLR